MSTDSNQPSAPKHTRIPSLLSGSSRSAAASRLPSPPASPGVSSPTPRPSTPQEGGHARSGGGLWSSAGPAASGLPPGSGPASYRAERDRDRRISGSSATSLLGLTGGGPAGLPPTGHSNPHTPPSSLRSSLNLNLAATRPEAGNLPRPSGSGLRPPTPTGTPMSSGYNTARGTGGGGAAAGAGAGTGAVAATPRDALVPALGGGSGGGEEGGAGGDGTSGHVERSGIQVAVRLRPLNDKERQRGERAGWAVDPEGNVGTLDAAGGFTPKHRFDTVFGPEADNAAVACRLALPLVGPALSGVNGTIFAYGVTSSGKTHTMMGTDQDPGVVPRVVRELFGQIATATAAAGGGGGGGQAAARSFTVRMSMMEIYNEVLNDLLDPSRSNLKVREDARSGLVVVEHLTEQQVASAEQALDLISRGETNRKVGATAFNEDSSRSHTITRIVVEARTVASAAAGGGSGRGHRTTVAVLSLIDLAGSESARATLSKGQRMEGSFINRSLLTLGTVIHKLAAGGGGHVPFRDSKLTRLLQPSLSGPGARVAVVCNVTPAAAQAEETANTLKFASRAKLVQVTARANEILDERSMLRRYQKEVVDLKRQLAEARRLLAAAGINYQPSLTSCGGGEAAAAATPSGKAGGNAGGEAVASVEAVAAAAGVAVMVPGLGLLPLDAVAAAVENERSQRQTAELEATMLRLKAERLQAIVEARGGADGDLPFGADPLSPALARAPSGASVQPPSPPPLLFQYQRPPSGASYGVRYAASSPRPGGGGGDASGVSSRSHSKRTSYSGAAVAAVAAALAGGGGDRASRGSLPGLEEGGQGLGSVSSPAASRRLSEAVATAELRAQVAAALTAGARVAGGAAGGAGGGVGSCSASVSGRATDMGSEADFADEELNDGLMAQIRDLMSEAQATDDGQRPSGGTATGQPQPRHQPSIPMTPGSSGDSVRGGGSGGNATSTAGGHAPGAGLGPTANGSSVSSSVRMRRRSTGQQSASAVSLSASSSYAGGLDGLELDRELELQVLHADREVLHDQLVASEAANEQLTGQVIELRRQLGCYEELTKTAANELSEIRRLKEAFHGRLQRENAALRQQLAAAGMQPVPAGGVQQQGQQQQPGGGGVAGVARGAGGMAGGSVGGAFGSPAPVPPPSGGRPPRTSLSGIPTPGGVGGGGGGVGSGTSAGGFGGPGSGGSAYTTPVAQRPPQLQLPRDSPASSCSSLPHQSPQQPQGGGAAGASGGGRSTTAGGYGTAAGGGVELDPGSAAFAAKLEAMEGVVRGLMQDRDRAARVEAERDRLVALLRQHGIPH